MKETKIKKNINHYEYTFKVYNRYEVRKAFIKSTSIKCTEMSQNFPMMGWLTMC